MIRVINDVPHASVVKQLVCRNCGATLEYTPNDVQMRVDSDYTGSKDTVHYISCPRCTKQLTVSRF